MINLKQHLIEETEDDISTKEQEIKESNEELAILNAKLKVEKKSVEMKDIEEDLKEDFTYSIQALENIIMMEENKNFELKKELNMLKYRKDVIKSQFSDSELDS